MQTTTSTQLGADGATLHRVRWAPTTPPRAELLLVHGYAEHSGRYRHVAECFCEAGIAVNAIDLRGHGQSTGVEIGHIDSFDRLVDDLAQVVADLGGDKPLFVFGHSLGGLATIRLAERDDAPFAGLVVSGSALVTAESIPAPLVAIANVLGRLAPELRTISLDGDAVSRVPEVRLDYDRDPLNFRGRVTAGTARQINLAMKAALADAKRITCPILILHGTADTLSSPMGSVRLADSVGSPDRTLSMWPGCFHELHHEPEADDVLTTVVEWITSHLEGDAPNLSDPTPRSA